jgi:hypothetical protein
MSNGRMTMNDALDRMWKEAVVVCFEVVAW